MYVLTNETEPNQYSPQVCDNFEESFKTVSSVRRGKASYNKSTKNEKISWFQNYCQTQNLTSTIVTSLKLQ